MTPTQMLFGVGTTRIASTKAVGAPPINVCTDYCTGGLAIVTVRLVDPGSGPNLVQSLRVPVGCVF